MCGISTLFEPSAPKWLEPTLRQMNALLRHRGPDGEGLVFFHSPRPGPLEAIPIAATDTPPGTSARSATPPNATLALGHRRLSILDLSAAGHQPMPDASGKLWLTFNGEIYNYLELRAELVALGHAFHTGTDTEVILAAYREWGEACLSRFNGMFAFVLVDTRRAHVFAARDRFGEKPLYLWRTPTGGLAIASEIKAFTAHPGWRASLNGQSAYCFLNWGVTDHGTDTLFDGVTQLRGGECLSAPLAELPRARQFRWYELSAPAFHGDLAAAGERFRDLLDDSIKLRLRADVPVGSCLSGGLDSSAIVCTMHAQLAGLADARQNTFSAYSDVARFDERRYIEEVVRATQARAHSLIPDPARLFAELDLLTWHQDEPFGSTSIFAQWCVYRAAREADVSVMLDGQGADEALGGYQGFFGPRLSGLIARGQWLTGFRESRALHREGLMRMGLQARMIANDLLPASAANSLRRLIGRAHAAPATLDLSRLQADPDRGWLRTFDPKAPVLALCRAQLLRLSLPMLLHWADRDSMAHSVEARLPFLDHRLVEFCLGLPEEHKIADGWTKRVLREGMKGRLPEAVRLRRDKLGFATAEEVWMRTSHREVFRTLLEDAIDAADGILTPEALRKATRILEGKEPFNFLVWRMISFGRWIKRFEVSLPSAP